MTERTFARLDASVVMELLTTSADVAKLFHPSLQWIDVTGHVPAVGWRLSGTAFVAPVVAVPTAPATPTLAELQAGLAALTARFAAYQAAQRG